MKIDSSYKSNLGAVSSRTTPATNTDKPATDSVNLSPVASALQNQSTPPVNTARIQEIKEAIAQGRFKINPEAIADGLIESARDLINNKQFSA